MIMKKNCVSFNQNDILFAAHGVRIRAFHDRINHEHNWTDFLDSTFLEAI